jgi:hypothetical protein
MVAPTIWSSEKELAFFSVLAETANVSRACSAVSIARQTAYNRYEEDKEFAEKWEQAVAVGICALEDEANRRAFEGVDKPVFYQGQRTGQWVDKDGKPTESKEGAVAFKPNVIREYSDTLAIFMLKAHKPEKYRERFEHTGAGGAPLIPPSSPEDTARRVAFILAQGIAAQEKDSSGRA